MRKMSAILVSLLGLLPLGAIAEEQLYVAKVLILKFDGSFDESVVLSTQAGLPLDRCELALKAWLGQYEAIFNATVKSMQAQGKQSAWSAECKPKD